MQRVGDRMMLTRKELIKKINEERKKRPKWMRKLTYKEREHLKEMEISALDKFRKQRHKDCSICEKIFTKTKEEKNTPVL